MKALLPKYNKKLINIAAEKDLSLTPLGIVGGWPIWLVRSASPHSSKRKKVLVIAGFHGEEQAGPWGILKWLENYHKENYKGIDISLIPVVNPTGFNIKKRYNTWNEITNQGFCHEELGHLPSREGRILLDHWQRLYSCAMNGQISLHEDDTIKKEYYLYTYEPTPDPGQFTCGLLDCLQKWFSTPLNGVSVSSDTNRLVPPYVVNGLIYNYHDSDWDDFMSHRGCPRVAVSETPALAKLEYRIDCHVDLIDTFIDLIRKGK
jgi:hypothetical protein